MTVAISWTYKGDRRQKGGRYAEPFQFQFKILHSGLAKLVEVSIRPIDKIATVVVMIRDMNK